MRIREVDARIERVGDKVVVVGDSFGDLRSAREVQSGYVFAYYIGRCSILLW